MKRILLVCPTHRDKREFSFIKAEQRCFFELYDYASLELEDLTAGRYENFDRMPPVQEVLDALLTKAKRHPFDGIISCDDYPGSSLAGILAHELKLPGPAPQANLLCQHKYYSRIAQRQCAPEAVPEFKLIHPETASKPPLAFPFFIKPVKSFFSVGAHRVDGPKQWKTALGKATLPKKFFEPFNYLLKKYSSYELDANFLIAESLLQGEQVTVEGYAYQNEIVIMGVVDSIMFPGTFSFQRFEYPASLPEPVQERMAQLTSQIINAIGLKNSFFSVEMVYNPAAQTIHIIEINPRMSSQFADLFEKVDGANSYAVALDLALGRRPVFSQRRGRYPMAASCVLRRFTDKKVKQLPTAREIEALCQRRPDIRVEVLATAGERLSQQMQDSASYRYGLINIGGRNREDILNIFNDCLTHLTFEFV